MPSSSHSDEPTSWPWALKNGKHIAPPIRTVSARSRKASSTPILSVTFAPPTTATSGRFGSSRMPLSVVTSRSSSRPGGARQQVRDALGRGVRAVRGPERVVDVHVGQLRVALGQGCVVLGLALEEAHVLDHHDVALGHVVEVGRERDLDAEQLTQTLRGGLERELLVHALRPPEMREQDEPGGPLLAQLLQGRQRRPDACVVGDLAVLVLRDVEVHADEDALALDVEIVKRAHAPAPSGRGPRSGWSSPTRCRTR